MRPRPSIRHIRIHGVALVVVGEEVFGRLSGAAGILELGLVPGVRQPAVEAVRRSPFELELDAVGVAGQGVLPVRRLAATRRGCSRGESRRLRDAAGRRRDGGTPIPTRATPGRAAARGPLRWSPTARAPAACLAGQTSSDRCVGAWCCTPAPNRARKPGTDFELGQQPRRGLALIEQLPVFDAHAGRDREARAGRPSILRPAGGRPGVVTSASSSVAGRACSGRRGD